MQLVTMATNQNKTSTHNIYTRKRRYLPELPRSSSIQMLIILLAMVTATGAVTYSVKEHSAPGYLIGNISKVVDNLPSSPIFSFLNTGEKVLKYFVLDENNAGVLRLSYDNVLDRETVCEYTTDCTLELQIAIMSSLSIDSSFKKIYVQINVIDINDHSPEFSKSSTTLTFLETVQIPSSLKPLPPARDSDTSFNYSIQSYDLVPADGPFELIYSQDNPTPMLRVVKPLDYEVQQNYSIQVIARDGGMPALEGVLKVNIYVQDVNDNAPVFDPDTYSKTVDENVERGSYLLTLKATDADSGENGKVKYSFSPRQSVSIISMFALNETTGELRLVGDLEGSSTEKYTFRVRASDMAFLDEATVTIMVEDTINSEPKMVLSTLSHGKSYSSVTEYANLGRPIAHIGVKDPDKGSNGVVFCRIPSEESYFSLQSYDVKEYKVIVSRELDRETISVHNVTVVCEDSGTPKLSVSRMFQVRIEDENDNPPKFDEDHVYTSIRENNDVGDKIITVNATDKDDPETDNGKIVYRLENVSKGDFTINKDTGTVYAGKSYDYENRRQINFTVVAEDKGKTRRSDKIAIGLTIEDVNDIVPYFPQKQFNLKVSEYGEPGESVGELKAFDYEQGVNGQLDISMITDYGPDFQRNNQNASPHFDNPAIVPFKVYPNGSVMLTSKVDYEEKNSYRFRVKVSDRGQPPLSDTAEILVSVLDENDNSPIILRPNVSDTTFVTSTGSDAAETIMTFDVRDDDSGGNGLLVYTITARNDSGRFQVDQTTGVVYRTRELSGTDWGIYKLSIMVRDSGVPPLSDIRTLLIHVTGRDGANGTYSGSGSGKGGNHYVIIALIIVCITILLSVTIVLIIVIMRRMDRRRKTHNGMGSGGPMHIPNPRAVTAFGDITKMDHRRIDSSSSSHPKHGGEKHGDKSLDNSMEQRMGQDGKFGFPPTSGSMNGSGVGDSYQTSQGNNLKLPTSASKDDDVDLEALQLRQVLLQAYQEAQAQGVVPEDGASDSSGDTITSDSGRGGSDEDVSHTNMATGNSMDDSRFHNGSFQSNMSTFGQSGSLKSSVKDPVRNSTRKHVTFKDMERFRNSVRSHSEDNPRYYGNVHQMSSQSDIPMTQLPDSRNHGQNILSLSSKARSSSNTELNVASYPENGNRMEKTDPAYTSLRGYPFAKNSPRGQGPPPPNTAAFEARGRDSPRLHTFSNPSVNAKQSFQIVGQHNSPRLPFYEGEDPSNNDQACTLEQWSQSPRNQTNGTSSLNSDSSSTSSPYMQMSSPRDRLKQSYPAPPANSKAALPSTFLGGVPALNLTNLDSPATSARNSPRGNLPQQHGGTSFRDSPRSDNGLGVNHPHYGNSPRQQQQQQQQTQQQQQPPSYHHHHPINDSSNNSIVQSSTHDSFRSTPRSCSPAPLLPPRESKESISNPLLHHKNNNNNNNNKHHFPQNPSQQTKMAAAFPDRVNLAPRDWTTESIATTEDGDDQHSTTTSGSYTIDNEEESMIHDHIDYPRQQDVVV